MEMEQIKLKHDVRHLLSRLHLPQQEQFQHFDVVALGQQIRILDSHHTEAALVVVAACLLLSG